jgi:hypothetical protein
MARQTASGGGGASDVAWESEVWYGVTLKEEPTLEPKGSPGWKGQPRKHVRGQFIWVVDGTDDAWIFDWLDLTVKSQTNGTPSACCSLMCALTQRNPRLEQTPWVDDETMEFGFDGNAQVPAGQFAPGIRVAVKGTVGQDSQGNARLNIHTYGAITALGQQAAAAAPQLSPDGRYRWDGQQWIPASPPMPAPPPTSPPPPQQQNLI